MGKRTAGLRASSDYRTTGAEGGRRLPYPFKSRGVRLAAAVGGGRSQWVDGSAA